MQQVGVMVQWVAKFRICCLLQLVMASSTADLKACMHSERHKLHKPARCFPCRRRAAIARLLRGQATALTCRP